MIIGGVIVLVVALAIALLVAVGKDPGPSAQDVAAGYVRALANGDFDAMYRMVDPELLRGRNRLDWIEASRHRPRVAITAVIVRPLVVETRDDDAVVDVTVDDDRTLAVRLTRRNRAWWVAAVDGTNAANPDSP